jgi:hypothetical protein
MKTVISVQDVPGTGSITPIDFTLFDSIPDRKKRVMLLLLFLKEHSALLYKAECAAKEYWVEQFMQAWQIYENQSKAIRERILQEVCDENIL